MDDHGSSHEFKSHEFTSFDSTTPKNEQYFSPEPDSQTPTPRILSNQTLLGENIVSMRRQHSSEHMDVELSPFTPSEATTPPSLQVPKTLSPPPLNNPHNNENNLLEFEQLVQSAATESPFRPAGNIRSRPPRVPQVSLHPTTRNVDNRHGRVSSNTDYSFLSGLTESPSEFSLPQRRTVSWDMNDPTTRRDNNHDRRGGVSPGAATNVSHKSTPASLLQPVLVDDSNRSTLPESIIMSRINTEISNNKIIGFQGGIITSSSFPGAKPVDLIPRDAGSLGTSEKKFGSIPTLQKKMQVRNSNSRETREISRDQQGLNNLSSNSIKNQPPQQTIDFISGVPDTGSFIQISNDRKYDTATSTPERKISTKRYSLRDVLAAAPKEGIDETEVLRNLEARTPSKSPPPILSMVSDSMINYCDDDAEQTPSGEVKRGLPPKGSRDTLPTKKLEELTKKLAGASPSSVKGDDEKTTKHERKATTLFSSLTTPDFLDSTDEQDIENGMTTPSGMSTCSDGKKKSVGRLQKFMKERNNDLHAFVNFLQPKEKALRATFIKYLHLVVLPSFGLAFFLFHVLGNPPTGKDANGGRLQQTKASSSWWVLFLGVRQMITLGLAAFAELVVIQFWTFRTRTFPKILGTTFSVVFAYSRGWPYILISWALFDLLLLSGERAFASHWLYWQDVFDMMNESNPSGDIVNSPVYKRLLYSLLVFGIAESVKRTVLGQRGGRRLVSRYRGDLANLMHKLVVLSEIAALTTASETLSAVKIGVEEMLESAAGKTETNDSFDYSEAATMVHSEGGREFSNSRRNDLSYYLDDWDEPELQDDGEEVPTMEAILQFRKTLGVISDDHPFSTGFGRAGTREECIQSSQDVYDRLISVSQTSNGYLDFETLCKIAKLEDGTVNQWKMKELVRIFRPNRSGEISKIDFIKSIDSVYKTLRMLLASIKNASQIDSAFERLVGTAFYILSAFIIMGIVGVDVNAILLFFGGAIVGCAFMIGSASSKYVEGLLFILVQRAYDIGDRIQIGTITSESSIYGPTSSVVVEKVDLFTTTVRVAATREVLSFTNGSLANTRIANLRKSLKADVNTILKFGVEVSNDQVEMFRQEILKYTRDRPREWVSVVIFRCNSVQADLGYVEYLIRLRHRDSWQSLAGVLQSRGNFLSFALEKQKELGMKYSAPPLPIEMTQERYNRARESFLFGGKDPDFEAYDHETKKDR